MNTNLSLSIKEEAYQIGFSYCGFAKAEYLAKQKVFFNEWLEKKHHSQMKYMENHVDKRLDPRLLFERAKTIVVCSINYYTNTDIAKDSNYKISKYAYGKDYHLVVKEKLSLLLNFIKHNNSHCEGKICVDSAPILEKAWAEKSGIGWIGKNTCLINKKSGSYNFLGALILNIELDYDKPSKNYCGNCNKCIDACPTKALLKPYSLNANKCLSYLNIESKEPIPDEIAEKSNGWIFGCDICQNVCPWNRFAKQHHIKEFEPLEATMNLAKKGHYAYSESEFKVQFKESAISRVKYNVIKQNILKINNKLTNQIK